MQVIAAGQVEGRDTFRTVRKGQSPGQRIDVHMARLNANSSPVGDVYESVKIPLLIVPRMTKRPGSMAAGHVERLA
jgi:hypothetical protein